MSSRIPIRVIMRFFQRRGSIQANKAANNGL